MKVNETRPLLDLSRGPTTVNQTEDKARESMDRRAVIRLFGYADIGGEVYEVGY